MTAEEADQRIILSRQTLRKYVQMVLSGDLPAMDLALMSDEIGQLERIADAHPGKAEKIRTLGEEWLKLMAIIRGKLN